MTEIGRKTFDGRDFFTGGIGDALDARTDCFAIQMYCASAALSHTATVLGSSQRECVPQHPEQRRTRINVDIHRPAVNFQSNQRDTPFELSGMRILGMNHGSRGLCRCALISRDVVYAMLAFRLSQESSSVAFLSHRFYHSPHGEKGKKRTKDK